MQGFGHRIPSRRALLGVSVAAASLLSVLAAGCLPVEAPPGGLQISTTPGLYPSFNTSVTDYVSRCDSSAPVQVSVSAPADTTVSVGGAPAASGDFTAEVTRDVGQSFTIVVQTSSQAPSTYSVRCLPADFPSLTGQTSGPTQAEYYITVPLPNGAKAKSYPTIFDDHGVPVWWGPPTNTYFATLLEGKIAWTINTSPGGAEEHNLDGSIARTINTNNPAGGLSDGHDVLHLPNGNDVMVTNVPRSPVDLTALGGPPTATVLDQVIQELKPDGTVAWSWDTYDHIPPSEMDSQWNQTFIVNGSSPYDVYHWNSIEFTGTGFILSFRHLDAVYNIDKTTGNVAWKLGGSPRAESLVVNNDPVFSGGDHFGGQHDARLLSDGTVTLHDNGSNRGRPPRAVRYQIDTSATPPTATLVEQLLDPLIASSFCCGSARKLDGGDWVMGWGGTNTATEMAPDGTREVLLQFGDGKILYRTIPVPFGQLDLGALRAGMDAQWAASGAAHTAQQPPSGEPAQAP
jgi:hypothetical protein